MVVAILSGFVGLIALVIAVRSGELISLAGLLAAILLLNALIRFVLARS